MVTYHQAMILVISKEGKELDDLNHVLVVVYDSLSQDGNTIQKGNDLIVNGKVPPMNNDVVGVVRFQALVCHRHDCVADRSRKSERRRKLWDAVV